MLDSAVFDKYAETYDAEFTHTSIGKAQRKRVWRYLDKIISTRSSILEINCGTGEDALYFSEKGCDVIATDASATMIEAAKNKTSHRSDSTKIIFDKSNFLQLKEKLNGKKFDTIFSNFGGLNCANKNDLKIIADDLSSLLNPSGSLIFVIMGTNCKWEQFYFLLKGNKKSAFRRKDKHGAITIVKDTPFTTYYFSPFEIKSIFNSDFEIVKTLPIGFFIPPSYLQPFFEKKNLLLKMLSALEKVIGNFSLFSNAADHYLIHLKLRENAERI